MKSLELEYGSQYVTIKVPENAEVLTLPEDQPLTQPAAAIRQALDTPLGTPPLAQLAAGKKNAAIVISDNTRPVPYRGSAGILKPILDILRTARVPQITVIVAAGTHREMQDSELRVLLDDAAFAPNVRIINHVCTDPAMLRRLGSTARTPDVTINRHYLDADLKILTGLVESHFMAGYSGGRKALCPGIVGQSVTYGFHSAAILDDPRSTSLSLDGNPCHEEALRIARMAGVDFILNVTLDRHKRLTGVYAGDLVQAHLAAINHCRNFAVIPCPHRYDLVITHSGHVGMNHYQCCKAAIEAARVVEPRGAIILLANLADRHPIGSADYRRCLSELVRLGAPNFRRTILSDPWTFIPEQWGAQEWANVFIHLQDPRRFFICSHQLAQGQPDLLAETNVASLCPQNPGETPAAWLARMVNYSLSQLHLTAEARILVLPDGPYAVPQLIPNT